MFDDSLESLFDSPCNGGGPSMYFHLLAAQYAQQTDGRSFGVCFVESKSCIELFLILGFLGGYISLRCMSM